MTLRLNTLFVCSQLVQTYLVCKGERSGVGNLVFYAPSTSTIIIISPERSEEYEVHCMRKQFKVSVAILAQLQDP